jgi:hypothetical protein
VNGIVVVRLSADQSIGDLPPLNEATSGATIPGGRN